MICTNPQKYFYNENFQIYGICTFSKIMSDNGNIEVVHVGIVWYIFHMSTVKGREQRRYDRIT